MLPLFHMQCTIIAGGESQLWSRAHALIQKAPCPILSISTEKDFKQQSLERLHTTLQKLCQSPGQGGLMVKMDLV